MYTKKSVPCGTDFKTTRYNLNRRRYSQRKKRTERTAHSAVRPSITHTGVRTLPAPTPRKAFFIIVIPCVSGKKLTILCITGGMTSTGSVVPEKMSIGK